MVELRGDERLEHEDRLATEEPLEIRFRAPGGLERRVGVTMRTPGHDFELAAGWLVHEGIAAVDSVRAVRYCTDAQLTDEQEFNVVTVELSAPPLRLPEARLVTSACGVCGADSVTEVLTLAAPRSDVVVPVDIVRSLPGLLRADQPAFERTGGLHAAGLFDESGQRVVVREDVGRHNALDKVVGSCILGARPVPVVLVLSGRVGFELVQKAIVSGIAIIVAVGAPSSLAVHLAREAGVTIVGFTRSDRCVVYAGQERIGV